ncbi:MAG: hypothetical protein JSS27_18885 [Planctomycetes bacterium]|nr:hypothetical protein [Planctomycetota bacterium]
MKQLELVAAVQIDRPGSERLQDCSGRSLVTVRLTDQAWLSCQGLADDCGCTTGDVVSLALSDVLDVLTPAISAMVEHHIQRRMTVLANTVLRIAV